MYSTGSTNVIDNADEERESMYSIKIADNCSCEVKKQQPEMKVKEETEVMSQITFEDELQDKVYIKRPHPVTKRDKRQIFEEGDRSLNLNNNLNYTTRNITSKGT